MVKLEWEALGRLVKKERDSLKERKVGKIGREDRKRQFCSGLAVV